MRNNSKHYIEKVKAAETNDYKLVLESKPTSLELNFALTYAMIEERINLIPKIIVLGGKPG